jgi:glycine dehydrogenase
MLKMEQFKNRHVGIAESEKETMLKFLGINSVEALIDQTIPADIRLPEPLSLPAPLSEQEYAEEIAQITSRNQVFASYIGMGWYDTITPAVIYRNVFENPVWYTSYTPYQAEISQGRLEALLNFQTALSSMRPLLPPKRQP